ncbi:MAG: DUF2993 domain-containing protein [Cyanobacteria bacterium SW_9_44_58]|nr:MAG: DUF2993 domain-containing protein [Cyanobacteria bacterium SW_9_44_58]
MIFNQSHFLTTILTPALRVWLYSQLDHLEGLHLHITSSDPQLLQGIIPEVFLESEFANYKGLQFDQISLTAQKIHVNLPQLLKGRPLQPLNPIPLSGRLRITETHLSDSLRSSLLQSGIQDLLRQLFQTDVLPSFHWESIRLDNNQCLLQGRRNVSVATPVLIQAAVNLSSPQHLLISPIKVEGIEINHELSPVEFDLGSQVQIDDLTITTEAIFLKGNLIVN